MVLHDRTSPLLRVVNLLLSPIVFHSFLFSIAVCPRGTQLGTFKFSFSDLSDLFLTNEKKTSKVLIFASVLAWSTGCSHYHHRQKCISSSSLFNVIQEDHHIPGHLIWKFRAKHCCAHVSKGNEWERKRRVFRILNSYRSDVEVLY